ncbi:hypothetical protein P692DRAFT_20858275 [Suillus brevipes Sb2]|nr:hypothetical protein P692DRAFT_20858275 [Suillus brevipes Sb2]
MFRSLLRFTTKPHRHDHQDAEKELVEVTDLFSHLVETDKTEFKNEYDRLQREIRLSKAGKSTARNIILDDCRALKCKVKKTIDDHRVACKKEEVSAPVGVGGLGDYQEPNTPPTNDASKTKSSHSNQPPNVKVIASLPTTSASTSAADKTPFKPQPGVASVTVKPRSGLPQSHHIPVYANLKQAIPQVTSGMSYEVDSMVMMGASAECPTMNIDSPGCTGAKIIPHGPQVAQQVLQPARPRRAVGRRAQQQPRNFLKGNYSSNGSMILCGSSVVGATLNVNATNCSGAVIHRDKHLKRVP